MGPSLAGLQIQSNLRPTLHAGVLSGLNSMVQKDPGGEEADFVRGIVQESAPMAMSAREVERVSEKDPELCGVRYDIQNGDWSQWKMPYYLGI